MLLLLFLVSLHLRTKGKDCFKEEKGSKVLGRRCSFSDRCDKWWEGLRLPSGQPVRCYTLGFLHTSHNFTVIEPIYLPLFAAVLGAKEGFSYLSCPPITPSLPPHPPLLP